MLRKIKNKLNIIRLKIKFRLMGYTYDKYLNISSIYPRSLITKPRNLKELIWYIKLKRSFKNTKKIINKKVTKETNPITDTDSFYHNPADWY